MADASGVVGGAVSLVTSLSSAFAALESIAPSIALLFGVGFAVQAGIRMMGMANDHSRHTLRHVITPIIICGFLLSFGWSVGLGSGAIGISCTPTVGGLNSCATSSLPAANASGGLSTGFFTAIFTIVSALGLFAILKGFFLAKAAGEGDAGGGGVDPAWQAFWHFFGGVACYNIGSTLKMLGILP